VRFTIQSFYSLISSFFLPSFLPSPCSPSVLVTSQYGYSANLERIMKAQAFADPSKAQFMLSKKTMEINPRHPLIAALKEKAVADPEGNDADAKDTAMLIYDAALLNSGFSIDDPKEFSARLFRSMKNGLNLESLDLLPEIEVQADEEPASSEEGSDEEASATSEEDGEEAAASSEESAEKEEL
jgi:Hsp90 protein